MQPYQSNQSDQSDQYFQVAAFRDKRTGQPMHLPATTTYPSSFVQQIQNVGKQVGQQSLPQSLTPFPAVSRAPAQSFPVVIPQFPQQMAQPTAHQVMMMQQSPGETPMFPVAKKRS